LKIYRDKNKKIRD